VLGVLLGLLRADVRACRGLLDPALGKLLLFWAVRARHVLAAWPAAGPACWPALLDVMLRGEAEAAALRDDRRGNAAGLHDMLRHKVLPEVLDLLVASLNAAAASTGEDDLRVSPDI
jgi:hypothetical protein